MLCIFCCRVDDDLEFYRIRLFSWNIDGLDMLSVEKRIKEICNIIKK